MKRSHFYDAGRFLRRPFMLQEFNREFVPWILHLIYPLIEEADHELHALIGQRDVEALIVMVASLPSGRCAVQ